MVSFALGYAGSVDFVFYLLLLCSQGFVLLTCDFDVGCSALGVVYVCVTLAATFVVDLRCV